MKQKLVTFYKTTRLNGDSVWAKGILKRNYQVGHTYRFNRKFPAHVFTVPYSDKGDIYIWQKRAEACGGRVIECSGYLEGRYIPCLNIYSDWDLTKPISMVEYIKCSTYFKVIREILPPNDGSYYPYTEAVIHKRGVTKGRICDAVVIFDRE